MAVYRYAVLTGYVVTFITDADEELANMLGFIRSDTAMVGDIWDGTTFTTPPPPLPTFQEMRAELALFLYEKEQTRITGVLTAMLDGIPTPENMAAFRTLLNTVNPT